MQSLTAAEHKVVERPTGLLAELAISERNAIHRASEVRFCAAGDVLLRANTRSRSVFFPINAVVSVLRMLRDGRSIEVGLIGNEGMVGIDAILDTRSDLDEVVVQSAGFVYCMGAEDLRHQFDATGRLQRSVLRFIHAFLAQAAQNIVCARYHGVAQRLAKWLLMNDDRSGCIGVEHATRLLAMSLGAAEAEIEVAVGRLAAAGALQYRRSMVVIERDVLETAACECYDAVRIQNRREAR